MSSDDPRGAGPAPDAPTDSAFDATLLDGGVGRRDAPGQETIVDDPALAGETVPGEPLPGDTLPTPPPEGAVAASSPAPVTSSSPTHRPTVLPRIELDGDEPQLVQELRARFDSLRPLGEGGAGEVFAALDNDIGRTVAVKKVRAEVRSPYALARFIEEIKTIGRLEHPNIIPIHDVGIDEQGDYYFVMKYVDGETLESIIERLQAGDREYHSLYTFEQRVQIFRGLLEAVAFAHANGVVHRDIKPANVMVGRYGEVVLMDWGIAKPLEGAEADIDDAFLEKAATELGDSDRVFKTRVGALVGTPAYMSPEQAQGQPVDQRSDIYSLCVLMHELLTLHHYLDDRKSLATMLEGVLNKPVPLASSVRGPGQPPVPMDLTWFLKKGLHKDRERRYASIQEMLDRLDARNEGIVPVECHITFTKRITSEMIRFIDRHPMISTMGMLGLIAGIVTLVVRSVL